MLEPIVEGFQMSPQQRYLWKLGQKERGNTAYVYAKLRLEGNLDTHMLYQAIERVVARYEILRTAFSPVSGMAFPLQVIREKALFSWQEILEDAENETGDAVLLQKMQQNLDGQQDLAFAASLLTLAPNSHRLLLLASALCLDTLSLFYLAQEIQREYQSGSANETPEVLQYADLSAWQNDLFDGEEAAEGIAFWRSYWQQKNIAQLLTQRIPFEHPYPQEVPGRFSLPLSQTFIITSKRFAETASLRDLYLTCWSLLLGWLMDTSNIVFGLRVNSRRYEELEGAIGPLTAILPFSVHIDEHSTASNAITAMHTALDEVVSWQEYFSWKYVQADEATCPALGFEFLELPSPSQEKALLALHFEDLGLTIKQPALSLIAIQMGGIPSLTIAYDPAYYQCADIENLGRRFLGLLEKVIAQPDSIIRNIELLDNEERLSLLQQWSTTPRLKAFTPQLLHEAFRVQAHKTPDTIALVTQDQQICYRVLDLWSTQLARALELQGVTNEARVGVCMERDLRNVISLLAILKAGGVYVPLDATAPIERLRWQCQDAHLHLLLTRWETLAAVPHLSELGVSLLVVDEHPEETGGQRENLLEAQAVLLGRPGTILQAAYLIYTSGSTGHPKGVIVEHHAAWNLLDGLRQTVYCDTQLSHPLRIGVNASLIFDASLQQVFQILDGHTLVFPDQALRLDAESFVAFLDEQGVQVLDGTPTHMKILSQFGLFQAPFPRILLVAGEALEKDLWQTLIQAPHIDAYNLYGPTECTIDATSVRLQALQTEPTIGRPLPGCEVYLLDCWLRPVPPGRVGELFIGGSVLARGYQENSVFTAEHFVPHPWGRNGGERLYRTGDLAKWDTDGRLYFVGRTDQQIKLHGYRIEPGEIEGRLKAHAAIEDAVIVLKTNQQGEGYLVAYVQKRRNASFQDEKELEGILRTWMKQHVPGYMLPWTYVWIQQWPLTPSGKIDRKGLSEPEEKRRGLRRAFVEPCTPLEKKLATIWGEVLDAQNVGIEDSFFELGGDSIRSIRVITMAREHGLHIGLQQLFSHQTIRELAEVLVEQDREQSTSVQTVAPFSLISFDDFTRLLEDVEDAYPLAMLQAGMIFHSEIEPETAIFQDTFSVHLRAPLRLETLQQALQNLTLRHPILRTSFDLTTYSQPLQSVHKTATIPLTMEDLCSLSHEQQEEALTLFREQEKTRRFDWTKAPLVRFKIHIRSADTFQFTLTEHHAILDGWSVASMLTELFQDYLTLIGLLPAKTIVTPGGQFREFIALELQALQLPETERFWASYLQEAPMLRLPRWPSSLQTSQKSSPKPRELAIDPEVTNGLMRLAQKAGVPLKSVVLAAHLFILSVLGDTDDIVTGLISNGRPEVEDGERILGLFLNTLPLRHHLQESSWLKLAQAVFQTEIELLPYRHYPMAQAQINRGRQPLFEVALNFAHFHVYERLRAFPEVEALGVEWSEQTNLALLVQFVVQPFTSALFMNLHGYGLSDEQLDIFAGYYLKTLEEMASHPECLFSSFSLLSTAEQAHMLSDWNQTAYAIPSKTIYDLLIEHAERTPEATAVRMGHQELSYRELCQKVEQMKRRLRCCGIRQEAIVGVLADRGPLLLIAMLGTMAAGGIYLPLDPQQPRRQQQIIAQCCPQIILTSARYHQHVEEFLQSRPAPDPLPVLIGIEEETQTEEDLALEPLSAQQAAYLIYTSGSTGTPKGAVLTHQGLMNHLWAKVCDLSLSANDCVAQTASQSFDISLWQFLAPLAVGGCVQILPDDIAHDPELLAQFLGQGTLSILEVVPSFLQWLLDILEKQRFEARNLRTLLVTGEAFPASLCRRWQRLYPAVELWNAYGPTECSDDVAHYRVKQELPSWASSIPIGRPVFNTQLYILNNRMAPVPPCVVGELYVGGSGVGRGYLGAPELTALNFIPDLVSGTASSRLYKTGDLARYLPDGTIEFLGRVDQQVKLRGHRIELGEIEAAISAYPAVREAVATLCYDYRSDPQLVAYITLRQPDASSEDTLRAELRHWLQGRLPGYMLPAVFIILEKIPLTAHGKIKRDALPFPELAQFSSQQEYSAPRTTLEESLASLWGEVLNQPIIGIKDNFFENLGGHSLLATQLISHIRTALQINLPLQSIFDQPTIEGLAMVIEEMLLEEIEHLER